MISRCGLICKKEGVSDQDFADYWLNVHGPVAAQMKNLRKYEQHLIIDDEHRHEIPASTVRLNGYSELQFENYSDMMEGVASLDGAGMADLANFTEGPCSVLVFVKKVDTAVPAYLKGRPLIKRMSFLGRKEGISPEEFQYQWWKVHSDLVKSMPGYVGYNQNLVIDRFVDGKPASYEELPIDGMVEFWFESMDAFNECYSSPEFLRTQAHGATFIGTVDTYLTETHRVV